MAETLPLNVVLLVGEDTGRHHGCYDEPYAHTPNLDRLAAEGCRYTNAFSHAPVCAPSRSGLITGRYPWSIGTHHMRSTLLNPPRLFTHELRDAGRYVAWPTKTDFNFEPPGDFADTTDDGWKDRLPAEPFFVYRNFDVTHESGVWDTPNWAGTVHADRVADLPEDLKHDPADAPVPAYLPDTPETRRDIARYFDLMTVQDQQIGEVLETIDNSPAAARTVVIYLTDHGRGLPREKRWCYDAGIRLPLIVRWPGQIEPGTTCDDLVAWVDIAPTILSLMGVAIPESYDGQVFLGPDTASPREFVFAGRDRMDEVFDRVRVARSKSYHYIRNDFPALPWAARQSYAEQEPTFRAMRREHAAGRLSGDAAVFMADHKPAEELYDPYADPEMVRNLADDPAHVRALDQHRTALDDFLGSIQDLGQTPETQLIANGLVADRLSREYRPKIEPLPESLRIGPERAPLTEEEAQAVTAGE
ncbi:MAG: sulfatase [Planctomycetota bacterium]